MSDGAMFFDADSGNAFDWCQTANEARELARVHVEEWSPFVLIVYGPDGAITECLSDDDFRDDLSATEGTGT